MEKRRRARINNCLNQLKAILIDSMRKDAPQHSKLEKADILEMTVRYVSALQRQRLMLDPTAVSKFRAGFSQCIGEVERCLGRMEREESLGCDRDLKSRLVTHLHQRLRLLPTSDDFRPGFPWTFPPPSISEPPMPVSFGDPAVFSNAVQPAFFWDKPEPPATVQEAGNVTDDGDSSARARGPAGTDDRVWRPW
ncbi:unnamed protein product [Darwinula stevensoni]|uniref:BHLH domain-containing protein n=1 Tax=Darwinula stevensoni TaxID=69355 RepID=A0A7R9AI21_9CRUS|nr:unnamed protein product [Darwinula stevensoni]CAG0905925.1 unnamed protein product [Darwinula stevensoni]